MWIKVALDISAIIRSDTSNYVYISGPNMELYQIDDSLREVLEEDGFLMFAWIELDSTIDWYDSDFLDVVQCKKLQEWLLQKLPTGKDELLKQVYQKMLDYTEKAILHNTGMSLNF